VTSRTIIRGPHGELEFLRDLHENWQGDVRLYRLRRSEHDAVKYIAISSVSNEYTNETMAFETDEDGEVISWDDLACVRTIGAFDEVARQLVYDGYVWQKDDEDEE
jgi:hypothetical protein